MKTAQFFVVLAVILAAGWLVLPREAADVTTGAVTAAMTLAGETFSCDQVLYLEEVELLSGSACS